MASVSGVNEVLSGLAGATAPAAKPSSAEVQNRFLTLLVTQMRNQDPLNPMDNAQITTQLAQLNTVAGIGELNETMKGLAANVAASQVLQSSALLGRNVMLPGGQIELVGGQALFGAQLAQSADSLLVEVLDAQGKVVHRVNTGAQQAGMLALHWDGALDAGGVAADGRYRVRLSANAAGQAVEVTGLAVAKVLSVSTEGGVRLNLSTGASAALGDILQIL